MAVIESIAMMDNVWNAFKRVLSSRDTSLFYSSESIHKHKNSNLKEVKTKYNTVNYNNQKRNNMKSLQYIVTTAVILSPSQAQNTYPPTSSQTTLASDYQVHTVAPTGSVARYPRPSPPPGSETYWPTTEDAYVMDMQVVEVAGSPVPTVIRLDGESVGVTVESTENAGVSGNDAPAPAATEDVPPNNNARVSRKNGLLESVVCGVVALLGFM